MIVKLTDHARQQMSENGITLEMIKNAITFGSKTKQTNWLKATYTYYEVCYKKIGDMHIIKTVMIK